MYTPPYQKHLFPELVTVLENYNIHCVGVCVCVCVKNYLLSDNIQFDTSTILSWQRTYDHCVRSVSELSRGHLSYWAQG